MGAVIVASGINEIRAAAERIRGLVRRTPLLAAEPTREHLGAVQGLLLKLEALPEERVCAIVCGPGTDGIASEAPC
jgi:hypothetical protein